ncbi:hypothetical protein [Pseudomonas proteolytica]|uniref:hypothetical protein n=1 Tax=Pseudomonas proteolytica TaxID=219574 RepID=UPI001EE36B5B|nr:hypothetical protein [Pseudomonas proteolytica]
MNINPAPALPNSTTTHSLSAVNPLPADTTAPAHRRQTRATTATSSPQNAAHRGDSGSPQTTNPEIAIQKRVIYGSDTVPAPSAGYTLQERKQRIDDYAFRVTMLIEEIPSINQGEMAVRFQNARLFMEPAGYFSGGLLAAGYDPHEKITVTFTSYTGVGKPENLSSTSKRTYFAWEIAAGALEHDKVQRGGPLNFNFMEIDPKDQTKVDDLESLGKNLQNHWEHEISKPMRDPSGQLATLSGQADAYAVRGTLQTLRSDTQSFKKLSPEGQEAVARTLDKNGQVIIPNIYGYPLSGYAFIPYTPYDGDYKNRPNQGLMLDLKNGTVREIHGDADFATWAKDNRDNLLRNFNTRDIQGGKDSHWPSAGYVLETLISGANAHFPGYHNLVSDEEIPASQLFNYTRARGSEYQLKFGNLYNGVADQYQAVNAKNALWSDQTQVFGSSQQDWKSAKDFWGNTFGYVPVIGNTGNIVFGVHDSLYGMTAQDRVGGNAAAVISGLQLAHELAPGAVESGLGEPAKVPGVPRAEDYQWRQNSQTNDFEFVHAPKPAKNTDEVTVPSQAQPANPLRPSQAGHISQHAVPNGEQLIENVKPNAKGIYQVKDATTNADRWLIRYTDATGISNVYEIRGDFKLSNGYVQIIDQQTRRPVMTVHSSGNGEWVSANGKGGIKWFWERSGSPPPSDDMKLPASFANHFVDLEGKPITGATKIDEFLKINAGSSYEFASSNFEDKGVIKTNFRVSWNIDETGFSVAPGEKAQPTEHSSSQYSPNFVLDINRNPYTVTTKEKGLSVSHRLDATANSAEGIRQARLAQFERTIPDRDLRARISQVAHQGSIAPATIDLNGGSVLQDGYYFGADDTQFHIEHDPSSKVTKVQITSKGHLSNPEKDINRVPGVEVIIKRTFTIREGNELDSLYTIDKDAPTTIEVVTLS